MILCMLAQYQLYKNNFYVRGEDDLIYDTIREQVFSDARDIANYYIYDVTTLNVEERFMIKNTNLRYKLVNEIGTVLARNTYSWVYPSDLNKWNFEIDITTNAFGNLEFTTDSNVVNHALKDEYTLHVYIDSSLVADDIYKDIFENIQFGNKVLAVIYPISFVSSLTAILFMCIFVKLHKKAEESPEGITPIDYTWLKNTYSFIKNWIQTAWNVLIMYLRKLSMVKQTVIIISGICVIELIILRSCQGNSNMMTLLWFFGRIILLPFIFNVIYDIGKIKIGAEELSSGHLEYKIPTENMGFELKKSADSLNNIGDALNVEIEKRLQSERMKTELITNVSHDIKTPITSIINYSMLIEKEPCDSPKHKEYAEVLVRKASHLKRLLDDLVEASKASTGNIEMKLEDCEANVLLTQVVGEFEQRLHDSKLELITKSPDNPIMIHVDSKRIWRVFENLMSNACKYSLEGSRVYLNLDQVGNEAIFSFRNTSKAMLNVSAEELMERFVRGDSSRSTEGNGLGLSIARSLTELQNGKMDIIIDGDLFKVILKFPVIS